MKEASQYTDSFYDSHVDESYNSAQRILPIVNNLFHPRSVIDVGCGIATWLKVWKEELNVDTIQGIEGPYVASKDLKVSSEFILFQDLKEKIEIGRKFDLAMSLEVAEHLPESNAATFVKELTELSDIVLFSASAPGQDGTYHLNEQYPEYWAALFQQHDYIAIDYLRDKIWSDAKIAWWYRQNILIYIKKDKVAEYPELTLSVENTDPKLLTRIHPELFSYVWTELKRTRPIGGYIRWKLYLLKKRLFKK